MSKINTRSKRVFRIGLIYDTADDYPEVSGPADRFVEFEPESTIRAMEKAVSLAGHKPVRVGAPHRLLDQKPEIDLIWNIGEGMGSRNREAWAPVLCEMRGIPYLGSDAHTLSVSLDKVLSKQIARHLGIPTPDWQVISYQEDGATSPLSCRPSSPSLKKKKTRTPGKSQKGDDLQRKIPPPLLPFPLFLKPRYEGTSKGVTPNSIVHSTKSFERQCRYLLDAYRQDVIAETFLPGPELTCAVAFHPLTALPVLERGLHSSGIGAHALDAINHRPGQEELSDAATLQSASHPDGDSPIECFSEAHVSGVICPEIESIITNWTMLLSCAFEVKDFARLDYKLTKEGHPMFLEINPLPTFGIESTFAIAAELRDTPYPEFLAEILRSGIKRLAL